MFKQKNKTYYIEISQQIISFIKRESEHIEISVLQKFQETLENNNISLEHNKDTLIFKNENTEIQKTKNNFSSAINAASFSLCLLTLKDTKTIKNIIKYGIQEFKNEYDFETEKMFRIMIKSALKLPENKRPYGIFLPFIGFITPKEFSKTTLWERPNYPTNEFIMNIATGFEKIDNFKHQDKDNNLI